MTFSGNIPRIGSLRHKFYGLGNQLQYLSGAFGYSGDLPYNLRSAQQGSDRPEYGTSSGKESEFATY